MTAHSDYHYSIAVHTVDKAVLYCLRALADLAQTTGNTLIVWANTGNNEWKHGNHIVCFHFSSPEYRDEFVEYAVRLLPRGSWVETARSDSDPAKRAR